MTAQLEDRDYDAQEVADLFEVSKQMVLLWLLHKSGDPMNGFKKGRKWFVTRDEIVRYANLRFGGQ